MKKKMLLACLLLAPVKLAGADGQWVLDKSILTYHVSHPLHRRTASAMQQKARVFATPDNATF